MSATRRPSLEHVQFGLDAQPGVIPPGGEGRIAVVLDRASFGPGGAEKITLALSAKRGDAGIQLSTDLVVEDFLAPGKPGSWWTFGGRWP